MSSRMLRSGIRSEILDLPVPSRHGKEKQKDKQKEMIPLSLSSTTSTQKASPSPARVYLAFLAALHASQALLAAINSSLSDD